MNFFTKILIAALLGFAAISCSKSQDLKSTTTVTDFTYVTAFDLNDTTNTPLVCDKLPSTVYKTDTLITVMVGKKFLDLQVIGPCPEIPDVLDAISTNKVPYHYKEGVLKNGDNYVLLDDGRFIVFLTNTPNECYEE